MSHTTGLIISVSGLRGIVGSGLDPVVAIRYSAAFAAGLAPGPIVITRDGRGTGAMLAAAVRSVLMAMGRPVLDADIAATPTTGVLVRHHGAAGGIQISASHNPPEYNGLKLFSAAGRVISAAEGQEVLDRYHTAQPAWVAHAAAGRAARPPWMPSPNMPAWCSRRSTWTGSPAAAFASCSTPITAPAVMLGPAAAGRTRLPT